jgi:D-sedoheptulose 7-phosphate isomerase
MDAIDIKSIENIIQIVKKKFIDQKKILTCGNGGSAYNASHFITDWNKFINQSTGKNFFGFSLNDNIGLMTAYANDLSYDDVFKGQLRNLMTKEDLLICVSGSGNSKNVIKAAEYANEIGADLVSLVGFDGGKLKKISKNFVHVPCNDMQICEDIHLMIGHMIMKSICSSDIF